MPSTHPSLRHPSVARSLTSLAVASAVALLLPACKPVPAPGAAPTPPPAATAAPTPVTTPSAPAATATPTSEVSATPTPGAATVAPTATPTPTARPTGRPTPTPTPSAPTRTVALPDPGARFEYQLGGADEPADATEVVIRDSTAPSTGRYDICYVNGFQTQPGDTERLIRTEPDLVLHHNGKPLRDDGWPDEVLYDITRADLRTRVAERIGKVIDGCAAAGFDAVEIDNLDSYTRSLGHITSDHTLAYAQLLIARTHAAGMAFAQKNTAELVTEVRDLGADLAVVEECGEWDECDVFTEQYPVVLAVEYDRDSYDALCTAQSRAATRLPELSLILRDMDVSTRATPGSVHETC